MGCGNIGGHYDERPQDNNVYTHAGMYQSTEAFSLVCAADTDTKRLDEFGRYWHVKRLYPTPEEMFKNEALDILSIATPDESHCRIILDSLKYKPPRMIFTEKPLATDLESARDVCEKCRKKNVTIVVDYIRRWDKNHQSIRQFLRQGELGPTQAIVGYYVRGLRHNGCQMINLLQFLFGKIISVQAMGDSTLGSLDGGPSINVRLTFENDTEAYMLAIDQRGYGFSIYEIDILGQNGRIRMIDGSKKIELYKAEKDSQFPNFKKLYVSKSTWERSTYGSAMIRAGDQLASFLAGKSNFLHNTALDAIDDLCVIEAALNSAKNNNRPAMVKRPDI